MLFIVENIWKLQVHESQNIFQESDLHPQHGSYNIHKDLEFIDVFLVLENVKY